MCNAFVEVVAGSEYGARHAWYEIVEGILVLQDEGNHDNLAGNSVACDFEGMTLEQAREKAAAINAEPVGHSYDGCHACKFGVEVYGPTDPPDWLVYEEPGEAGELRTLIREFLARKRGFADLREAVD